MNMYGGRGVILPCTLNHDTRWRQTVHALNDAISRHTNQGCLNLLIYDVTVNQAVALLQFNSYTASSHEN